MSKAYVFGRSLADNAGSNAAAGMDISFGGFVSCSQKPLRWTDLSPRGFLPSVSLNVSKGNTKTLHLK